LLGIALGYLLKNLKSKEEIFGFVLAFILLGEGIALHLHLSELLFIMSMAFVVNNLSLRKTNTAIETLNTLGFPLIATFFALAGTRLDIKLLPSIGIVGIVYFFARILGKLGGAYLGAKVSSAPKVIQKYIGFSLWPQIGVAVALAIMVERDFGHLGAVGSNLAKLAVNILLFTTIFTEILGPLMTKISLEKAGEIKVR
ncbi:MAG: cation:proton antiporter, partial [Thermodesulfobacteriota bacterium]